MTRWPWLAVGGLLLALTLGTAITWGFSVAAYGRAQRVAGFASYTVCDGIAQQIRETQPGWVVGACVLDVSGRGAPLPGAVHTP
jgi:hypothetical protein